MSKKETYYQCLIEKREKDTISATTALIPEKFAKFGKSVKIKDSKGKWMYNWVVMKVFSTAINLDDMLLIEKQHKDHRKVSDI